MSEKNLNFEAALKEFEEILNQLSNTDLSIDEAIKMHEEALEKYKVCEEILNTTSQKIEIYKKEQEAKNV